jgi:CubicO group peptidase (beta-lactamase class C family)
MKQRGFSKKRIDQMRDFLKGYVDRGEVPGMATLVSRRGEIHINTIGALTFGGKTPVRRDTLFRITSMTKPITAVATLILLEDCKLRLDDAVSNWLPELSQRSVLKRLNGPLDDTVPAEREITVRDLLTFRMGFGMILGSSEDYPILKAIEDQQLVGVGPPNPSAPHSPDEWIRRLGQLPLMHQPGERWMYNMGSYVLGVLIARVSGKPLETFFRERIFDPLGMKDTSFSVPAKKLSRFATAYWFDSEENRLEAFDEPQKSEWAQPPAFPDGGAGLVSTLDDYFAFTQMLMNLGKLPGKKKREQLLSKSSIELMTTDQLTSVQKSLSAWFPGHWDNVGYGMGVSVVTHRDSTMATPGQYGWDGGYGSSWRSDPKEGMIGITLTQRTFDSPKLTSVCQDFWTLAYRAIEG